MVITINRLSNIVLVIGVILLFTGGLLFYNGESFKSKAVKTKGLIVGFYQRTSSRKGSAFNNTWSPIAEYTGQNGEKKTYISHMSSNTAYYSIGDSVTVYYDKFFSEHVQIEGIDGFFGAYVFAGFGLFLILFRLIYFLIKRNEYKGVRTIHSPFRE
ncbi:DUF3592 domain-containing protein [Chitinophaga sp. CF118]|uniref:DUF3592 domain-containing protein n=1 Tax=Chitinophaga sp. CF118 TaxID=1884367 RepID=UPI0015A71544|nr:DUF3592 domain-containing protein [Chitinophaga sp. CF118]